MNAAALARPLTPLDTLTYSRALEDRLDAGRVPGTRVVTARAVPCNPPGTAWVPPF